MSKKKNFLAAVQRETPQKLYNNQFKIVHQVTECTVDVMLVASVAALFH